MTETTSPPKNTSGSRGTLAWSRRLLAGLTALSERPETTPERKVKLRHLLRAQKAVVTMREKAEEP